MYTFGRRIYYKLISGEPITDTGEVITTLENYKKNTVEEDLRTLPALQGYTINDIGYIELNFGDFKDDFENLNFYRIDTITQTIQFVRREQETEVVWEEPLIFKVTNLETENQYLGIEASEREIQQIILGQQLAEFEIQLLMGGL